MSVYPGLTVMLLFSSAIVATVASRMRRSSALLTIAVFAVVGFILAFVFNYRTTYGIAMAIQLALAAVASMFSTVKEPSEARSRTRVFRYVASAVCLVLGFVAFQLTFIAPLERGAPNASYHTIWHTVVLGLANPKKPVG